VQQKVVRKSDVFNRDMIGTASRTVCNNSIQRTTQLMGRSCDVKRESVAVDEQTKLISVWVVVAVQSDVEVAGDVDRLLVNGDSIQDGGQFVVEGLLYRRRTRTIYQHHDCTELPNDFTNADHLERGRLIVDRDRRQ